MQRQNDINSPTYLKLFDMKKPSDVKELSTEIARQTTSSGKEDEDSINAKNWLRNYVNSADFLAAYNDRSLELTAEAAYWSVKLGLDVLLAKMKYAEIREFHPMAERYYLEKTERSNLIKEVCNNLHKPANSFEASYALGQVAWCVYVHNNSFEKMKEEEKRYDSKSPSPRC